MSDLDTEDLLTKMLMDLGFPENDSYPLWAIELANRLLDAGWKKNES